MTTLFLCKRVGWKVSVRLGKRKDLGKSQDEGPAPCDRILREREMSKNSLRDFQ